MAAEEHPLKLFDINFLVVGDQQQRLAASEAMSGRGHDHGVHDMQRDLAGVALLE